VEPGSIRRGDRVEIEQKSPAPHRGSDDSLSGSF
jgi:hypothetical protein